MKTFKEEIIEVLEKHGLALMTGDLEKKYDDPVVNDIILILIKWAERKKKGRKAITGDWEHLLPNSSQYNQVLQDLIDYLKDK